MQPDRLPAGMKLARYELVRPIGSGGMGTVYEAVHRSLGRRVALKVLHAQPADASLAAHRAERFLREGRSAAQVRHPHIVDVFDFGVEDGCLYLVMELVDGISLAEMLRRDTKLSLPMAVATLLPILSAVAELHAAGIIHRDLKPANILLARGDGVCPKLADFGVSRFDDGSPPITQSGALVGTPEYLAPELLREKGPATAWSDQYALGVILYECTTGVRPFKGSTTYELLHAVVNEEATKPSAHTPSLPTRFEEVLLRAMNRQPEKRFASVDEFAEALLSFAVEAVAHRWRREFTPSSSAIETTVALARNSSEPAERQARHAVWALPFLIVVAGVAITLRSLQPHLFPAVLAPQRTATSATLEAGLPIPPTDQAVTTHFAIVDRRGTAPAMQTALESNAAVSAPPPARKIRRPSPIAASAGPVSPVDSAAAAPILRGQNGAFILDVP